MPQITAKWWAGLARVDWHVSLRILRSGVFGTWPDEAVVAVLLEHVRRPTRDSADREDGREQNDVDAERGIRRRRVEVDVRVQLLLILHDGFGCLCPLE